MLDFNLKWNASVAQQRERSFFDCTGGMTRSATILVLVINQQFAVVFSYYLFTTVSKFHLVCVMVYGVGMGGVCSKHLSKRGQSVFSQIGLQSQTMTK